MSSSYQRAVRGQRSNAPVLIGLGILVAGFASIPMMLRKTGDNSNLLLQDKALTGSQIQRGAYLNSGSKDAGPDPVRDSFETAKHFSSYPIQRCVVLQDWDMKSHTYKGQSVSNFDEKVVQQLAPQFLEEKR